MTNAETHAAFFAHLVELVPAKYYLHTDADRVSLKYMKKADARDAKALFKAQHKAAKRAALDPTKAKTTLDIQREKAAEAAQKNVEGHGQGGAHPVGSPILHLSSGTAPAREELRLRLQQKLQALRQERKASEEAKSADKAKEWREKAYSSGREKLGKIQQRSKEVKRPAEVARQGPSDQGPAQKKSKTEPATAAPSAGAESMPISNLNFGESRQNKGKKLNKAQLLAKAEMKQQEPKSKEELWSVAAARAAGQKVYDDPKLLRKSLKKDAKLKEKKTKAWKERIAAQEDEKKQRQDKRKSNISARIQGKKDKKKERREKKLLRAGFEGRKAGFINPSGK